MINIQQLDSLYKLYGFSKDMEKDGVAIYLYSGGYFHNAEIVQYNRTSTDIKKLQDEYVTLGYSVHITDYKTVDETHENLFKGFFALSNTNQRLLHEYNNFCDLQSKKLGGTKYSYIECRYYYNQEIHNSGLINTIYNRFFQEGAQLTILEAPAGFGKTCTSYEIINKLSSECSEKAPILAELSKNRKATVFRYVLLSEIDAKFSNLSSELVNNEIRNGRVPLIIDGFDELLSKTTNIQQGINKSEVEEAQTMLDTIADLFTDNSQAKILLTSRKSSIFTGEIFDEWVGDKLSSCTITRIQLIEPTVSEWLGSEKAALLQATGINLESIANPILLSILRNESITSFQNDGNIIESILEKYFNLLLTREQERQGLPLSVLEQQKIMRKLASLMVQFDISSEEPSFIQQLLNEIIQEESESFINRYNEFGIDSEGRPNEEQFLMKLAHHALLDRVSTNSNQIGFVNDFIYGNMIGEAILNKDLPVDVISSKYVDLATTAYAVRKKSIRDNLFKNLKSAINKLSQEQQLIIDIKLNQRLTRNYQEQYFDALNFREEFLFTEDFNFTNCIFSSCTFEHCNIPLSTFFMCQFYECRFYSIKTIPNTHENCHLIFAGCIGHEDFAQLAYHNNIITDNETDYEQIVLQQFWKKGYERAEPRKTYRTLFKGISMQEADYIANAIESLINREILIKKIYCLEINFSKMNEIKAILGR